MIAKAKPDLIAAVAYLRKSTKGRMADGRERQEKSIDQQKTEIVAMANDRYQIVRWYIDEGVSGWKRERKAPNSIGCYRTRESKRIL